MTYASIVLPSDGEYVNDYLLAAAVLCSSVDGLQLRWALATVAYVGGTVRVVIRPRWRCGVAEYSALETGQLSAPSFDTRLRTDVTKYS